MRSRIGAPSIFGRAASETAGGGSAPAADGWFAAAGCACSLPRHAPDRTAAMAAAARSRWRRKGGMHSLYAADHADDAVCRGLRGPRGMPRTTCGEGRSGLTRLLVRDRPLRIAHPQPAIAVGL